MLQPEIVNHALETSLSLNKLYIQSLPYCVQDSGSKYHVQITSKWEYTRATINIKLHMHSSVGKDHDCLLGAQILKQQKLVKTPTKCYQQNFQTTYNPTKSWNTTWMKWNWT